MVNKEKIIAIIPARFASTRFPGKLLHIIQGKPLIEHTLQNARRCKILNEIFIATDHHDIFSHITSLKGAAIMTSPACHNGTERLLESLQKKPSLQKTDFVVNLQGDHPCISPETITQAVQLLRSDKTAVMATAASVVDYNTAKSPHIVKCVIDKNNNALYFSRSLIPYPKYQKEKAHFYHHIGFYVYRTAFLLEVANLLKTPLEEEEDLEQLRILENGYRIKVAIVKEKALGVDILSDIQKVEKELCP